MKYLLLLLLLTGCSTVPVAQKFPEAPKELLEPCTQLKEIPADVHLSNLTKVVVENYTEYHLCENKVSAWQSWYTQQKKIFQELK